jgi:Outer membrane protein beta-barrel domain
MQRFIVSLILLVMLVSTQLWSQGAVVPGKLFLGGSVGSSFLKTKPTEIQGEDLKIDANGFAYKIFAGYKFPKIIGIEADYRNLGTVKDKLMDIEFESNVKGFDIFATGTLNFSMLEVFAKAGYFFWSSEVKGGDYSEKANDGDFVWGFGAGIGLGKLGVRAEWENFKVADMDNVSMLSAGISYNIL